MSTSQSMISAQLSPCLTVGSAAAGRETLLAAFAPHDAVVAHIEADARVDLAGVQLLLSARDYARRASKAFALAEPAKGQLLDVLRRGGFLEQMSGDDRQFWLHGEPTP